MDENMEKVMSDGADYLVFYGVKEVARMLRCSPPVARELMARHDFPLLKVGRKLMVSKSALEAWAMERRV